MEGSNHGESVGLRAGFEMQRDTCAIMLEFFKPIQLSDGVGGTIPIKIITPFAPVSR